MGIAFRFGVAQGSKLRACDDLRYARTNLACVVETPIKLVNWDHVAELPNALNANGRDWSFFKADHEAAYKQLPLKDSHAKLGVVALRSPIGQSWYGLVSRAMVFGAVAAVLHFYNVFSRLIAELFTQLFGIPLLVFFGDFGDIAPYEVSDTALHVFTLSLEAGNHPEDSKIRSGHARDFSGLGR